MRLVRSVLLVEQREIGFEVEGFEAVRRGYREYRSRAGRERVP